MSNKPQNTSSENEEIHQSAHNETASGNEKEPTAEGDSEEQESSEITDESKTDESKTDESKTDESKTAVEGQESTDPIKEDTEENAHLEDENTSNEEQEEEELWSDDETRSALEALFFVADEPLTKRELSKLVPNADKETINRAITQLTLDYGGMKGIHLVEIDHGFQFRTNPDLSEVILKMYEAKPLRLSKALLETLAIVAYQQPVTKARADEIRGVDCSGSLKKLIGFDLISIIGRADDIGRPNLYATTSRFLEFFGLNTITDMPTLEEFEVDALELVGEDLRDFLPEDDRESILADHVQDGKIDREEHGELGHRIDDQVEINTNEDKAVEVLASSAANDDGVINSDHDHHLEEE